MNSHKISSNQTNDEFKRLCEFLKAKPQGQKDQFKARCPCHDDKNPSLSLTLNNNKILYKCFAGCSQESLFRKFQSLGIRTNEIQHSFSKILPKGIRKNFGGKNYRTHWPYRSITGEELGHVVRYEDKEGVKSVVPYFKIRNGTWAPGLGQKEARPLYALDLLHSFPHAIVVIVEGEKCAESLNRLDPEKTHVVSTTWQGGAPNWRFTDWKPLIGRGCILWPDNDPSGQKAMEELAEYLKGLKICN